MGVYQIYYNEPSHPVIICLIYFPGYFEQTDGISRTSKYFITRLLSVITSLLRYIESFPRFDLKFPRNLINQPLLREHHEKVLLLKCAYAGISAAVQGRSRREVVASGGLLLSPLPWRICCL